MSLRMSVWRWIRQRRHTPTEYILQLTMSMHGWPLQTDVFHSRQFGDDEILMQVASSKHQLPLNAHGQSTYGQQLHQMGPCFVTLAQVRTKEREG